MAHFGATTSRLKYSLWRGIEGEVNLPLGRRKVKCSSFSNTSWVKGSASCSVMSTALLVAMSTVR